MAVFSSVSFSRMLHGSACTSAGSCVEAPCSSAPPKSNRPDCCACAACASAHSKARPTLASVQARSGCSRSKPPALTSASTTRLLTRERSTRLAKSKMLVNGRATSLCSVRPSRAATMASTAPWPGALDGAQAVVDQLVAGAPRRGLEAVDADVDVGRRERDAELLRVGEQHLQLLAVAHFDGHVGRVELRGAMGLQPGGVVRQQRVGGGVRLVEAVARELLHQVEDLVGLRRRRSCSWRRPRGRSRDAWPSPRPSSCPSRGAACRRRPSE